MSNVPPGHRVVTRTSAITANYENTDPQKAVGDIEGIFIKKDTGKTVFGVGTKQPFSRISMGDINSPLEEFKKCNGKSITIIHLFKPN